MILKLMFNVNQLFAALEASVQLTCKPKYLFVNACHHVPKNTILFAALMVSHTVTFAKCEKNRAKESKRSKSSTKDYAVCTF